MSNIISLNVLRLTVSQRKALEKDSALVIDNPPAEARWYIEDLVSKTDGTPTAVLALLLHISRKHLTTITEFQYEVTVDRTKSKAKKTVEVETHIFILQVPDKPAEVAEASAQKVEETETISKEPVGVEADEADEVEVEDEAEETTEDVEEVETATKD